MSNDQGYIMIASDWRGMSRFDIPVIVKALAADPNLVFNIRDSIIQGYAFKAGITHFCQSSLLKMDFMKFNGASIKQHEKKPRMMFYGISQGGILGSAYSTLMGPSKLLNGAAIVSGGTPFSMLMGRSVIFPKYHKLMLLNLAQNRHVRIFISMMQMCYDSVEAGGILSSTKAEDRVQTLIQTGLGDSFVTTISTLILARSYNASIFPSNNPSTIFELHTMTTDDENIKPNSVLTEIMYEEESKSLPITNTDGGFNPVHLCLMSDPYAVTQLTEFINTGNFIDVCPLQGGCRRKSSWERWNKDNCL